MTDSRSDSTTTPTRAGVASALLPGLGQVATGKRRIGWVLVALSLSALLIAAVMLLAGHTSDTAANLVNPDVLLTLFVVNLLVLAIRGWSTADAWHRAGGRLIAAGLGALLLFVAVPHIALGYYAWQSRSTINEIFVTEPAATAAAPAIPSTTTTSLADPLVPANTIPLITTTSTTLPLGTDRLTVLLLGGDAGPGRIGVRTDTMIVATIDTTTGDAVLFGLPRNIGGFEFSNGQVYTSSEQGLLNEVYRYGTWYPERFAGVDPGASAVMDVASTMLGLPIDNFVLINLVGFAELIDAFGGVDVKVTRDIPAPVFDREQGTHTNIVIEEGIHHMDGDLALAFARSRTGSSDYDRMGRQRCLLTSFADQLNPFSVMLHFDPILASLKQNVSTDIPVDDLPDLMKLAPKVALDRTLVVGFDNEYRKGYTAKGLAKPDIEKIQQAVELATTDPERARIELGIPPASQACS
jgi:LCP family protein required for cell wall assembly